MTGVGGSDVTSHDLSGVEGATEVDAGVGAADLEGSSAGLALTLLAPRIETVRSSGFQ